MEIASQKKVNKVEEKIFCCFLCTRSIGTVVACSQAYPVGEELWDAFDSIFFIQDKRVVKRGKVVAIKSDFPCFHLQHLVCLVYYIKDMAEKGAEGRYKCPIRDCTNVFSSWTDLILIDQCNLTYVTPFPQCMMRMHRMENLLIFQGPHNKFGGYNRPDVTQKEREYEEFRRRYKDELQKAEEENLRSHNQTTAIAASPTKLGGKEDKELQQPVPVSSSHSAEALTNPEETQCHSQSQAVFKPIKAGDPPLPKGDPCPPIPPSDLSPSKVSVSSLVDPRTITARMRGLRGEQGHRSAFIQATKRMRQSVDEEENDSVAPVYPRMFIPIRNRVRSPPRPFTSGAVPKPLPGISALQSVPLAVVTPAPSIVNVPPPPRGKPTIAFMREKYAVQDAEDISSAESESESEDEATKIVREIDYVETLLVSAANTNNSNINDIDEGIVKQSAVVTVAVNGVVTQPRIVNEENCKDLVLGSNNMDEGAALVVSEQNVEAIVNDEHGEISISDMEPIGVNFDGSFDELFGSFFASYSTEKDANVHATQQISNNQ